MTTPEEIRSSLLWGFGLNYEANELEIRPLRDGILILKNQDELKWLISDLIEQLQAWSEGEKHTINNNQGQHDYTVMPLACPNQERRDALFLAIAKILRNT